MVGNFWCFEVFKQIMTDSIDQSINDLDGVGPAENRPSTAEAPPLAKSTHLAKLP